MVKLFWNTHNQIKSSVANHDYIWGNYHKENSDKWIYEILNKVNFSLIDNLNSLESDDILILVDFFFFVFLHIRVFFWDVIVKSFF